MKKIKSPVRTSEYNGKAININMENKNIPQETLVGATKDETLYEIASEPEILEPKMPETLRAIEAVVKDNPQFKDMNFIQLNKNEEFQQKLKAYIIKNPSATISEVPTTIEVLKSVIPQKHIKPNNKLANKITKDIVDEGEFNLIISSKKAKKEVFTKVMLAYDNRYINLSGQKYTPYDREVYDGVVTLYMSGNDIVTPAMVYRAMNGLTETEYIKTQALETVKKSLDKSRYMQITIDYTEEAKLYNKKIEKTLYEGYLLAAEKITVKINGYEHEAYKLLRKPILYEYAQISGQIITVPNKLLQTKDAIRSTDEVIVIRGYLLRQIEWIKNDKTERNENITYKNIYEELEISRKILDEKSYENKTGKIRSHVKAILDEWKEKKYIQGYKEYKEGNTLIGVTIM
jgi:hypothetical protein